MQQISSRSTFFYKRIFPVILLGFLGLFVVVVFAAKNNQGHPPLFALIMPLVMGVFVFFLLRKLVWDLADQVMDAGDALIVRFGNDEERVPLSYIINISYSNMMNPPRVTLTLRAPSRFGREIAFCAPTRFVPLAKSPVIDDLIERVDAARRAAR